MKAWFVALIFSLASINEAQAQYLAQKDGNADFYSAAKAGAVDKLVEHLDQGTKIDSQDSQGYTALIYAAYYGQQAVVDLLLKRGADSCRKDKRGNTATLGAIFKGHFGIAKTLIRTQCVSQANEAGQTPLMFAALFGRNDIAQLLLKSGADPYLKDRMGNNSVTLAEGQGNDAFIKLISGARPTPL